MTEGYGIISTSQAVHDPVLWAHYADSHYGIALEFDHTLDDSIFKMEYSEKRPRIEIDKWGPFNHDEVIKPIF